MDDLLLTPGVSALPVDTLWGPLGELLCGPLGGGLVEGSEELLEQSLAPEATAPLDSVLPPTPPNAVPAGPIAAPSRPRRTGLADAARPAVEASPPAAPRGAKARKPAVSSSAGSDAAAAAKPASTGSPAAVRKGPCSHCGTSKSPLWRRNPHAPQKTLCNACGLRATRGKALPAEGSLRDVRADDQGASPAAPGSGVAPTERAERRGAGAALGPRRQTTKATAASRRR